MRILLNKYVATNQIPCVLSTVLHHLWFFFILIFVAATPFLFVLWVFLYFSVL